MTFFRAGRRCNRPMGLQTGAIKNSMVTASSQWDNYHAAFMGRLHWGRRGRYMGAWSAKHNNRYQYLQVDFGRAAKIIRIATQGRQDADQWVTQYYVMHSLDLLRFSEYKERNNRRVSEELWGELALIFFTQAWLPIYEDYLAVYNYQNCLGWRVNFWNMRNTLEEI